MLPDPREDLTDVLRLLHLLASAAIAAAVVCPMSARAAQPAPADLIATLLPAVVNITITVHSTAGPVEGNMVSQPTESDRTDQSSGFFIAPSGLLVTNRHAIAGASEIIVSLHDKTRLKACVLAVAAQSDVAVLKVVPHMPVATVAFGDSDALRPGDRVFLIGNPLGLGSTVTAGIVSALDRNTEQSGFGSFFQIDAALNHGNSGGPVFNAAGEVVGIATALQSPGSEIGSVGLGLAIAGRDARLVVDRLLTEGGLRLGWIGAHIQPVTAEIAAAVQLPAATGSIVTVVDDDSPATRAGLVAGDIILKLADDDGTNPRTLNDRIAGTAAGTVVELTLWRNGAQQTVPVVVGESPADKAMTTPPVSPACGAARPDRPDLGLVLAPLTDDARGKLGLRSHETGVLVSDVLAGTAAGDRAIAPGSVIENVQRRPVAAASDVQAGIAAARQENAPFVLMLVRSAAGLHWVALPLHPPA